MSTVDCPHGDDAATCPPCRRAAGKDAVPAGPTVEREFIARYPGDCTSCHLPIYVGQLVARLSTGRNIHAGCVSA